MGILQLSSTVCTGGRHKDENIYIYIFRQTVRVSGFYFSRIGPPSSPSSKSTRLYILVMPCCFRRPCNLGTRFSRNSMVVDCEASGFALKEACFPSSACLFWTVSPPVPFLAETRSSAGCRSTIPAPSQERPWIPKWFSRTGRSCPPPEQHLEVLLIDVFILDAP